MRTNERKEIRIKTYWSLQWRGVVRRCNVPRKEQIRSKLIR